MSLPDRNNPYSFQEFLDWRNNVDYYADDSFLQKVAKYYSGDQWPEVDKAAREISRKASFKWRDLSDAAAVPEKRPYMVHYDGHKNRIDRIARPMETLIMEKEVFAERIFSDSTPPWVRLIKMYLIYENSEACISCPIVCTEGLVRLLDKFADTPELKRILTHCKDGIDGDVAIGSQFLSEIQGGSDVPANLVEAVKEDGIWRLYGAKFFCSATHADYAVVTAKPHGSEKVALFIVPAWLPGDKEKERRNGCTIDRIKWKMGTSELTTGEITYNGAVAYPVGPLDKGVANVVGIVLSLSRLTVGLSSGAAMARGYREAKKYCELRNAFGMRLADFPMVAAQLKTLERSTQRTTAGSFKLYADFLNLKGGLGIGLNADEPMEDKKHRFRVRQMVMLQKMAAAWDAMDACRLAMSLFGGHGVMEDFSTLPRFFRDGAVNELWEGPRNVLLTQIHRDFQRVISWYPPKDFVADMLKGADPALIKALGDEMDELANYPNLFEMNEKTMEICTRWDGYCQRLFNTYQDLALAQVNAS
ncbi:MAG: acyl-CoA dehydrogenase family protein [Desulfatibacillum sp.]|nr:acyl-CoA dehydrogenase family protein [Desulfatibacillum sp.]